MKPWFVSATGTDLGKTYVLCALVRALRGRGVRVSVLKPVLSGFTPDDLAGTDSGRLLAAAGIGVNGETVAGITPWRFLPPLSPDMAARRAGVEVRLAAVQRFCVEALAQEGVGFVEGAGGIMSPLGTDCLNIDLAAGLEARVLLVAGAYLGTISHTLTAVAALEARGLLPAGVVLSGFQDGPVPLAETQACLQGYVRAPVFCVARGAGVPDALVDLVMGG